MMAFDFMDKPAAGSISSALEELQMLGAVEKKEKIQVGSIVILIVTLHRNRCHYRYVFLTLTFALLFLISSPFLDWLLV